MVSFALQKITPPLFATYFFYFLIGFELKPSYFAQAKRNLENAKFEKEENLISLMDEVA